MPPNYKLHSGDPQDIDLETVRPLTTLERSYLQTFPESFNFFGTKTNLEQMIGNAVPINMAKFVALTIMGYKTLSEKLQPQVYELGFLRDSEKLTDIEMLE